MENKIDKVIDDFIDNENHETQNKEFNKRVIKKSDNSIIERLDKIIIAENGKQLLREVY